MEVLFTVMGTPRSVELPMLSISSLSEKLNKKKMKPCKEAYKVGERDLF